MGCVESLVRFRYSLRDLSDSVFDSGDVFDSRLTQACTPVDCIPQIVCSTATPLRYGSGEKPVQPSVSTHRPDLVIPHPPNCVRRDRCDLVPGVSILYNHTWKHLRVTQRSNDGPKRNVGSLASKLLSHVQSSGVDESFVPRSSSC